MQAIPGRSSQHMPSKPLGTIPALQPRSRRVGMLIPPPAFSLDAPQAHGAFDEANPPSPTSSRPPPVVPARSPLRPPPRAIQITPSRSEGTPHDAAAMPTLHARNRSYVSLNGLLDSIQSEKTLPLRPESPDSLSPVDDGTASSGSSVHIPVPVPPLSKRTHALLEVLSSERAYASDLAIIRDIHMPLALGLPPPYQHMPVTPPASNSSSRTVSTASDSSGSSQQGPPMTREDAKIIFSNVAELAVFADQFSEELEKALGSVLQGGQGEDSVGALFLEMIPQLEPLYKVYITRHPTALTHLNSLPQTPALTAYLAQTRTLASSLTSAWDLPSLLIKPVQRLLKYSLLLAAILDETPDTHSDKPHLLRAKAKMEEVARGVNEDRRRWEVVKEVLTAKPGETPIKNSKKGLNAGVAASVNLNRIKSIRNAKEKEGNEEEAYVARMARELKTIDAFVQELAKRAVEWGTLVRALMTQLRTWAAGFGRVIGLSEEAQSEAFDAFLLVVEDQLMPLTEALERTIQSTLLRTLAQLIETTHAPLRLLAAMDTLEPMHYTLLNTNYGGKGNERRPPPQLLAGSQSYLALRGQLAAELPLYLGLLQRGLASAITGFGATQTRFWGDVRDRWAELWDALRVEGEMNAGAEETRRVWMSRWGEIERRAGALNIVNPRKIYQEKKPEVAPAAASVISMLNSLEAPRSHSQRPPAAPSVVSLLGSLDPSASPSASAHSHIVSGPFPLMPSSPSSHSTKTRSASLRSGRSGKSRGSRPDEFGEYVPVPMPVPSMHSRTPPSSPHRLPTQASSSRMMMALGPGGEGREQGADEERGRTPGKPAMRRKMTETMKLSQPLAMAPARRRSSSAKSLGSPMRSGFTATSPPQSHSHSHQPHSHTHSQTPSQPPTWENARAKYACRVIHPCYPPPGVSYYSFPFFKLEVGAVFDVLKETGHPALHEDLPLYVDDGEDCLLLVRSQRREVGWALASFLVPED